MLQEYILTDYVSISNYLHECLAGEDMLCFYSKDYPAFTCTLRNLGKKSSIEIDFNNELILYIYSRNNDYVGLIRFNKLSVMHTIDDAPVETIDDLEEVK